MPRALPLARQATDTLQGAFRQRLGEVLLVFHRIERAVLPRVVAGSFIHPIDALYCVTKR